MKRYRYVVAATCLLLSAAGFVGLYAINPTEEKEDPTKNENIVGEVDQNQKEEDELDIPSSQDPNQEIAQKDPVESEIMEETETPVENESVVENITEETLHFRPENGLVWPIEGTTLLDYSMDATIFFPTLQQYQYNPAMIISGKVNQKVYFIAKGKVVDISTNEETGCTVTQDIGDGYKAVYGQLKEVNFQVGDMVESGQVVGYVSEPTKYYSVEGSNVYFQILKDGVPVDPEEILP